MMSSELHIPSIIRPHFDPPTDGNGEGRGDEEEENEAVAVRELHRKQDHNPNYLPRVKKERDQARVTFAPSVPVPDSKETKTIIPALGDGKLKVDHKHYEQWARNPNRKAPSTALLRGIQQLKAKMSREKDSIDDAPPHGQPETNRIPSFPSMARERSNMSRSSSNSASMAMALPSAVRPKPAPNVSLDTNFNRSLSSIRHILKPSQYVFESVNAKRPPKKDCFDQMSEDLQRLNRKIEVNAAHEALDGARDMNVKPRTGLSKIQDRNPFPVSVNQPVCIGDHVFLVNEPLYFRSAETWRLRTKLDTRGSEFSVSSAKTNDTSLTSGDTTSGLGTQHLKPSFLINNASDNEQNDEMFRGSLLRSDSYFRNFLPKKSNRRIPAVISSAELYDFSQLAEVRGVNEVKNFERTKTDTSIYLKGPKLTKWVPRTQRMSALLN